MNRAPGELAMADFAAAGAAHAASLAHRVGWEVVVQHEVLAVLAFQRVDDLLVLAGAEGGHHQRLGFAAGEQRGAMGAWQYADLNFDRTHGLGVAAIDALAGVENVVAHGLVFELAEDFDNHGTDCVVALEQGDALGLDLGYLGLALLLHHNAIGLGQLIDDAGRDQLLAHRARGSRSHWQIPRFLGALFGQADDRLDDRLELRVTEIHGAQHDFFRKFFGLGFDHQHALVGAGDHQVELRVREACSGPG